MNIPDPRDLATVTAALRCFQTYLRGRCPNHTDLEDISTNGGEYEPMNPAEIDKLIGRLHEAEVPRLAGEES